MEKEFVTNEIALKLKELGFNEGCLAKYCRYNPNDEIKLFPHTQDFFKGYFYSCNNSDYSEDKIAAPLWQQAIDFLSEKYDIVIEITIQNYFDTYANSYTYQAVCKVYRNKELDRSVVVRNTKNNNNNIFYLYKEAREQAILKAIELIKEK